MGLQLELNPDDTSVFNVRELCALSRVKNYLKRRGTYIYPEHDCGTVNLWVLSRM